MSTSHARALPRVSEDPDSVYLNSAQVRTRYGGMSDMALWRWLHHDSLEFPKPLVISKRRFWLASALTEWERKRAIASGAPAARTNKSGVTNCDHSR